MTVKKIVAMFALTARAQDAAAPAAPGDGRIFADSLDGVSVENFLDGLTSSDYSSSYLYEEVGPADGDYNDLFSYDGTDVNNSAGRPVNSDSSAGKELDLSQLGETNFTNGDHAGKNNGFNTCRTCVGQTAAECFAGSATETCNDAQDACRVEMRSRVIGEFFNVLQQNDNLSQAVRSSPSFGPAAHRAVLVKRNRVVTSSLVSVQRRV
jgi:hypothetical protein